MLLGLGVVLATLPRPARATLEAYDVDLGESYVELASESVVSLSFGSLFNLGPVGLVGQGAGGSRTYLEGILEVLVTDTDECASGRAIEIVDRRSTIEPRTNGSWLPGSQGNDTGPEAAQLGVTLHGGTLPIGLDAALRGLVISIGHSGEAQCLEPLSTAVWKFSLGPYALSPTARRGVLDYRSDVSFLSGSSPLHGGGRVPVQTSVAYGFYIEPDGGPKRIEIPIEAHLSLTEDRFGIGVPWTVDLSLEGRIVAAIPEPAASVLGLGALLTLAALARLRRRAVSPSQCQRSASSTFLLLFSVGLFGCEPGLSLSPDEGVPGTIDAVDCRLPEATLTAGAASVELPKKSDCEAGQVELSGASYTMSADVSMDPVEPSDTLLTDTASCQLNVGRVLTAIPYGCELGKSHRFDTGATHNGNPGLITVYATILRVLGGRDGSTATATVSVSCSGSGETVDIEVDASVARCARDPFCRASGVVHVAGEGDRCVVVQALSVSGSALHDASHALTVTLRTNAGRQVSCTSDQECAGQLGMPICHSGACQAGEIGDLCDHDIDCDATDDYICASQGCSRGVADSACGTEADCLDDFLCGAAGRCTLPAECDPVAQSGCEHDAMCAWHEDADLTERGTRCVDRGSVGPSEPCDPTDGPACLAGLTCHEETCARLCREASDCFAGQSCSPALAWGTFQDVETETRGAVGVCRDLPLDTPLDGYVDLHTHPMSHLGFGGKLVHGAPYPDSPMPAGTLHMGGGCNSVSGPAGPPIRALGECTATHSVWEFPGNTCGNSIRHLVITKVEDEHSAHGPDAFGAPTFVDWPAHDDITHQKMWVDWIERSHQHGLNVMVALAVNSHTLATAIKGNTPHDDRTSGNQQIEAIKDFVDAYDFMTVAYSSEDLRRIVLEGNLAVVIGVELDDIGNFNSQYRQNPSAPSDMVIRREIRRLYDMGVRYAFPVHLIDNVFGGSAVYTNDFNAANRFQWGRWWELECADDDRITWQHEPVRGVLDQTAQLVGLGILPTDIVPLPQGCATPETGHQNIRGLQRRGEVAIREMMRLGMMIDIDHASRHTVDDILAIAVEEDYPLVSGHNGPVTKINPNDPDAKRDEKERTPEQYRDLGSIGSLIGVSFAWESAESFGVTLEEVLDQTGGAGLALGSDINGLVRSPGGPCAGPEGCPGGVPPIDYERGDFPLPIASMTTRPGTDSEYTREWDYNEEGIAHYGLLPEFLHHMRQEGGEIGYDALFDGADAFAETWGKAEDRASDVDQTVLRYPSGQSCDSHDDCANDRCDRGDFTTKTNRCIPNDEEGEIGEYCTHHNHCMPGDSCRLEELRNYGTCRAPAGLGAGCGDDSGCLSGHCDTIERACVSASGTGITGGFCTEDFQCRSNYCLGDTCRSFGGLGEICNNGRNCQSAFVCDWDWVFNTGSGKCVHNGNNGAPGDYCSNNNQCHVGDFCNLVPDSGIEGTCSDPLAYGVHCANSGECASTVCDNTDYVCVPPSGTGNTGTYCTQDFQCRSNDCNETANSCRDYRQLGESCTGGRICESHLKCDGPTNKCAHAGNNGAPGDFCSNNDQCHVGDFCNLVPDSGIEGTCSDPLAYGVHCANSGECASTVCDNTDYVCVPPSGTGNTGTYCTQDFQCRSNDCNETANSCRAYRQLGESCTGGRICESHLKCDGPTNKCAHAGNNGAPGDFCSNNDQCRIGDFCNLVPDGGFEGTCSRPLSYGVHCANNGECASRVCDNTDYVCVPPGGTGNTGTYCTQDFQCKSNDCNETAHSCRAYRQLGEFCTNGRICESHLKCDGPTNKCAHTGNNGAPGDFCSNHDQCYVGDFCNLVPDSGIEGICSDPLPYGAHCAHSGECASRVCDNADHVCVPPGGTGSTGTYCTQDFQCKSNDCNETANSCRDYRQLGESCTNGRICESHLKCDGPTNKCAHTGNNGAPGDFCSNNDQCYPGRPCLIPSGDDEGTCG